MSKMMSANKNMVQYFLFIISRVFHDVLRIYIQEYFMHILKKIKQTYVIIRVGREKNSRLFYAKIEEK